MPVPAFPSSDLPRIKRFGAAMAALATAALAYPVLAVPALAAGAWLAAAELRRRRPAAPRTVMLLGHDAANGEEIAHDSSLARQHAMVVGDEAVRIGYFADLLQNAAEPGTGGILISPDPERTLYHKVVAVCAAAGRQDDLLVLNFNPHVGRDFGAHPVRSHTFNPFAGGSPGGLAQMLYALLRDRLDPDGADGAMWSGRAMAFLTALMAVLVWKRDAGRLELTARAIADHADLAALFDLHAEADLPEKAAGALYGYLSSLPGFDAERGRHQRQAAADQHAFLQQRLVGVLNQLDTAYPHILRAASPDVVIEDVIRRRRILLVVLPDGDDPAFAAVGRLIVASLRNFAGAALGSSIKAAWPAAADVRPCHGPRPFFVLANDVHRYMIDGMAIFAAHGRSLNLSLTFGVAPEMLRFDDREAKSIIANTSTKVFLRVSDGAVRRAAAVGHYTEADMVAMAAQPRASRMEMSERLDLRNLKPEEGFLTRHDEYHRIRIDRFPSSGGSWSRFNRLVAFESPVSVATGSAA